MKFYRFVVLSTPNNIILSVFPEKSMKLEKYIFNLLSIEQTLANLFQIQYTLQISPASFSVFNKPLKLRVVHITKDLKIYIFSKMAATILIKFSGFIVHLKPSSMTLLAFSKKNA